MENLDLVFSEKEFHFPMVFVKGTGDEMYLFGAENEQRKIRVKDFYISKFLVTEKLWQYILAETVIAEGHKPQVNRSHYSIVEKNGFLEKLNKKTSRHCRLPTETEWEYAARGGNHWGDYFLFSGGDNLNELGWYKENSNNEVKPVGLKRANQLGIYDMSGNVWEWCQDWFVRDTDLIPKDGSSYITKTEDKVLRGGCNHNGAIHCTVHKRYEIPPNTIDGAIGFRIVFSN